MSDYIPVPFPHMVLNSHDVPPPDYEMWNSWKVDASHTAEHIAGWIREVAIGQENGRLSTLIFNSHGTPGKILVGRGITEADLHHFQQFKKDKKSGICTQIWIIACRVSGSDDNVSGGPSGSAFCQLLAKTTMAEVTAAVRNQPSSGPISIPPWHVDSWVGEVYTYFPGGAVARRQ